MNESTSTTAAPQDYVVKPVTPEHLEKAIDIWSLAFGFADRDRWQSFYETMLDETYGTFHKGELVCLSGISHFEMWFGDRLVPCGGIAAVASDPAYRRRGLMRLSIARCLESLHDKRVPLASLWPFSYPYYARMGWAVTDFRYEVEAAARILPDYGDSRHFKRISNEQFEVLKPVHNRWIEKSNLSIKRNDTQWRRMLNNPHRDSHLYAHEKGYMVLNSRGVKARRLEILEWAWLDQVALLDGLSLLRRMQDLNFDKVVFVCSDVDPILTLGITDPQFLVTKKPGVMTRIVHTEAFMELLPDNAPALVIDDPLQVSKSYRVAEDSSNDAFRVDPGRLVQYVTATFKDRPQAVPEALFGLHKDKSAFTAEFF